MINRDSIINISCNFVIYNFKILFIEIVLFQILEFEIYDYLILLFFIIIDSNPSRSGNYTSSLLLDLNNNHPNSTPKLTTKLRRGSNREGGKIVF